MDLELRALYVETEVVDGWVAHGEEDGVNGEALDPDPPPPMWWISQTDSYWNFGLQYFNLSSKYTELG